MAFDITKMQQDFAAEGAFNAIRRYVQQGHVSSTIAEGWAAGVFTMLGEKIAEAKKEIRHIEHALERLSEVCGQGARRSEFQVLGQRVLGLSREMTTFDGWVASLYETELTMLMFVNPLRAKAKPLEMARAMQALTQKRIAEGDLLLKAPELFRPGAQASN